MLSIKLPTCLSSLFFTQYTAYCRESQPVEKIVRVRRSLLKDWNFPSARELTVDKRDFDFQFTDA